MEESTIAHLSRPEDRSHIFAWYNLIGMAGVAAGLNACGWVTSHLTESRNWDVLATYRAVFLGYAVAGALKFILAMLLSVGCEIRSAEPQVKASRGETTPLLREQNPQQTAASPSPQKHGAWSSISPESRLIVFRLCILFAFDNFASGLAPM